MDTERVKHPSFANIYIGRTYCSGQKNLFGSSIKHSETITLKISPAYMARDLNYDRYYADNTPYIEVEMSQAQFAQAITSLNMGAGVPVTLTRLNGEYIEPCPFVDKREQFNNEFRDDMQRVSKEIDEVTAEVEKLVEEKRNFSKADREKILKALSNVKHQISSNYPYMYSMFNEQMDKTVSEAKAEIESHLQGRMEDVAARAMMQEKRADMLPEQEPDEDTGMQMGGM